jgi:hypothetical protein
MPGTTIEKGRTGIVMSKAARTATETSDPVRLICPGAALLHLSVDTVTAGSITQIDIQERVGDKVKTIYSLTALAISAAGLYPWLFATGAPAAGSWTGVVAGLLPERFQVIVTLAGGSNITFGLKATSFGV